MSQPWNEVEPGKERTEIEKKYLGIYDTVNFLDQPLPGWSQMLLEFWVT